MIQFMAWCLFRSSRHFIDHVRIPTSTEPISQIADLMIHHQVINNLRSTVCVGYCRARTTSNEIHFAMTRIKCSVKLRKNIYTTKWEKGKRFQLKKHTHTRGVCAFLFFFFGVNIWMHFSLYDSGKNRRARCIIGKRTRDRISSWPMANC